LGVSIQRPSGAFGPGPFAMLPVTHESHVNMIQGIICHKYQSKFRRSLSIDDRESTNFGSIYPTALRYIAIAVLDLPPLKTNGAPPLGTVTVTPSAVVFAYLLHQ
jgi:hypothetical protein